jgi:hypothetical protein
MMAAEEVGEFTKEPAEQPQPRRGRRRKAKPTEDTPKRLCGFPPPKEK